ncbi:MAG: fibronectin type III domain-containing protein [Saprospiraceae bacterium]
MNLKQLFQPWIGISMLLLGSHHAIAQCDPPTALWLVPPQTSTALVLKWPPVAGATQYQIRYWDNSASDDKTIVDDCGPAPFTLRGLRKNTVYYLEIRSKCGNSTSGWSPSVSSTTINSSGLCNNPPSGLVVTSGISEINMQWASTGSHTIRYRLGDTGDWLIPAGALNIQNPPFSITGLSPGMYQVEIKRNCSATTGDYHRSTVTIGDPCATPAAPMVIADNTSALVELLDAVGVIGYNLEYRTGMSGSWISAGNNIPPSNYLLNPPLVPANHYQVQIQAVCIFGSSAFSPPVSFTTLPETGPCLANKNAGKNMTANEILLLNQKLNNPSPFSFGSMIGLNDGGLVFRSYQNEGSNQITQLTTQFRNFHTMDEDFDNSLQGYDQNIKPKDTNPEGSPAHTAYNKGLYTLYRQTHGFSNITGATELLQYAPQSWKEKIYKESDWSASGPAGIMSSFENYTKKFIDEFAPANGVSTQILVSNFQVGNEIWDYPMKEDYHSLLIGARSAFIKKYGEKSGGGWKMKLVAGAFQAYRDNNCNSILRDFSNCDGALERHDFIGDYLEVADCGLLKDLDAVDCHPYSFKPGTTQWTYPEDPNSEGWQIRNLAAWLDANKNNANGVLKNTQLWTTEYGYDSHHENGVGEKTQAAYLLRGLLLLSRHHFEKVFFYNAFDVARPSDQYYNGLYNSSGFWRLGTHPANSAWASPIEAHGATAKPAWYGMLDLKNRFGDHVFHKALVEEADAFVFLIAKPDSTEPYLVFWSPQHTNDANINEDLSLDVVVNWQASLPENYKVDTTLAQTFAESTFPGESFQAATQMECGITIITAIKRNPAFIRLSLCSACVNISDPGSIVGPANSSGNSPFDPELISGGIEASGGNGGDVVYQWQQSLDNSNFVDIPGAIDAGYDPPSLTEVVYFRRAARRSSCTDYLYTTAVKITPVVVLGCPNVLSFQRHPYTYVECNEAGEYYYEIAVTNITVDDKINLENLPTSGLLLSMSSLNGIAFTPPTFQANIQIIGLNQLQWLIKASNGINQTLRLSYCWPNSYPDPVDLSIATSLCSGQGKSCVEGFNKTDPESGARSDANSVNTSEPFGFTVAPNPGTDHLLLTYSGSTVAQATLRIVAATGQCLFTRYISSLEDQHQLEIDTHDFPSGIYFLSLGTGSDVKWVLWKRV